VNEWQPRNFSEVHLQILQKLARRALDCQNQMMKLSSRTSKLKKSYTLLLLLLNK
jgi:hypothetical protein